MNSVDLRGIDEDNYLVILEMGINTLKYHQDRLRKLAIAKVSVGESKYSDDQVVIQALQSAMDKTAIRMIQIRRSLIDILMSPGIDSSSRKKTTKEIDFSNEIRLTNWFADTGVDPSEYSKKVS